MAATQIRERAAGAIDQLELQERVNEILNRHPAVGLAVGIVRNGRLEFFHGHGFADVASRTPITEDTVFRIGSITKTFTAIAVMQLWEQGLIDLDAPANDYLRAYQLIPAKPGFRPATVRHLLTHTAGIPEVIHVADLLHLDWGPFDSRPATLSVGVGEPMPSLAEYYRGGLRQVVQPGTAFAYSNHGFATLGQIVEDVSGVPLERYFHEHIFEPLGMADSDLVRSEGVASRLATGYALRPDGAKAVPDRDWMGAGSARAYSTIRDMARYLAALIGGGTNEHGSVLKRATLATMFASHYQPDLRLPGMGLGFFPSDASGHHVVGHEGILPGFTSQLLVAPEDGVGLVALTNGSSGAMMWMPIDFGGLLRHLLAVADDAIRGDIPQHPEIWDELCGRYQLPPRISDLRQRLIFGGGVQIFVRGGRLVLRVLTPVPALYGGLDLHPDDEEDPYVFRLDLSKFGVGMVPVVFGSDPGAGLTAVHTDFGQPMSLHKRPARGNQGAWPKAALGALGFATAVIAVRRRSRRHTAMQP